MTAIDPVAAHAQARPVSSLSMRLFQPVLGVGHQARLETTKALRAARIGMFPEWYLAMGYFVSIIGGVSAAVLAAGGWFLARGRIAPVWGVLIILGTGVLAYAVFQLGFLLYPRLKAQGRARRIDEEFPSVVTLCYALARGGMNSISVFRVIAEEKDVYGEISVEFGLIVRDVDLFGEDMTSALRNTANSTPSETLRTFYEGLITIINSGADPRDYFKRQAELQITMSELKLERDLEQAGLLAEVYVSGLLVIPLLVIVILAGLSVLGTVADTVIPIVVFGVMPIGTVVYLLLVDVMLPPVSFRNPLPRQDPLTDFGLDSIPTVTVAVAKTAPAEAEFSEEVAEIREAEKQGGDAAFHRRVRMELFRIRAHRTWQRFVDRAISQPAEAVDLSGIGAIILLAAGGAWMYFSGLRGGDLVLPGTTLFLATAVVVAIPVAVFHEMRMRRMRTIDGALPEMVGKLAGFNERGIGLLQSFRILGRAVSGPLSTELRAVDRDVSWNGMLGNAIKRMRLRVNTLRMTKLDVLLGRASAATGNLKEVLDIAAADALRSLNLRTKQRQAMMTYVVIIYLVFAVFLYILFTVANLFYQEGGLGAVSEGTSGAGIGGAGIPAATAKFYFFYGGLIQGGAAGLVAGRLGEGHVLSGIKHAAILCTVTWLVFTLGVL